MRVCTWLEDIIQRNGRDTGRQMKKIQWTGLLTCHDPWEYMWIIVTLWLLGFSLCLLQNFIQHFILYLHTLTRNKKTTSDYELKLVRNNVLLTCPGIPHVVTILPATSVKINKVRSLSFSNNFQNLFTDYMLNGQHYEGTIFNTSLFFWVVSFTSETRKARFNERGFYHLDTLSCFTRLLATLKSSMAMNKLESPIP